MSIKNQFSQHAYEYNKFNIIQQIAAKALIRDIKTNPKNILEVGCGSGQVFKYINWNIEKYSAIDFSPQMCQLHPKNKKVEVYCLDFDSQEFRELISDKRFDIIISSSALQWSKDLDKLLKAFGKSSHRISATLFTSNTFKSMHEIIGQKSPILSKNEIKEKFSNYFKCEFEVHKYNLEFNNKKDLFAYIKHSGVSGADPSLDFKTAKKLYNDYKLDYLEFEIIFVKTISRL